MNIKSAALAHGLKEQVIEIPEWAENGADPVKVLVREFTSGQRNRFVGIVRMASEKGKPIPEEYTAKIVIEVAFDPESGARAFDRVDIEALTASPAGPLERIANTCLELSGITDEAIQAAEKNSARVIEEPSS